MDRKTLLSRVAQSEDERLCLGRVLDKARICAERNIPAVTAFLTPREQLLAQEVLTAAAVGCRYTFWGGYETAVRKKLCFLPDWQESAPDISEITALRAAFYQENSLTHRDILGSLMGLGITRETVGDILVSPKSADILVSSATANFIRQNWESAGREALRVTAIEESALFIPEETATEESATVSSLRLDCFISAACHLSRGKACDAIAAGRVQLNWCDCLKGDRLVSPGDTITVRSWGKCTVESVGQPTKKGRLPITWKHNQ